LPGTGKIHNAGYPTTLKLIYTVASFDIGYKTQVNINIYHSSVIWYLLDMYKYS